MTDAGDLDAALPCPLCGYDLRGLPAGRCPECGHGFDPDALRRARLDEHPYLFEHHARRPWRSLPATLWHALRPGRFWETLRPDMPVRRRPLGVLAAVLVVGVVGFAVLDVARVAVTLNVENARGYREQAEYYETADPAEARRLDDIAGGRPGDFLRDVRTWYPSPRTKVFWQHVRWEVEGLLGTPTLLAAAWPVVTFASLLVFQQSLRRAKIKAGHLARVAVYAAVPLLLLWPTAVVLGLALATFDAAAIYGASPVPAALNHVLGRPHPAEVLALLGCLAWATFSLWQAHRRYLRLPHAAATVLASQAMVLLGILAILGAFV